MTLVVNLFAGPGAGKSTTAAHTFALLKQEGINCELVGEYAKDRVWDNHLDCLSDQIYIFGKQYHRMHRLLNKVDVIVTDAPILLGVYYGSHMPDSFKRLVVDVHNEMNNLNVWVNRTKKYQEIGRLQTEKEALDVDSGMKQMLEVFGVNYFSISGNEYAAGNLLNIIKGVL